MGNLPGRSGGRPSFTLPRAAGAPSSRLGGTAAGPVGGRGRHLAGPAHPAPLPPRMGPGTTPSAPRGRRRCRSRPALIYECGVGRSSARLRCAEERKAAKLGLTPAGGSRGPPGAGGGPRRSWPWPWSPPRRSGRPGGGRSAPEPAGAKPPTLPRQGQLLRDLNKKELLPREVTSQLRVKTKVRAGGQKVVPSSHLRQGDSPFLRRGHTGPARLVIAAATAELHGRDGNVSDKVLVIFCPVGFSSVNPVVKGKRSYI